MVLGVLAFAGIQNALLLTNFNQEASGIVTGGLLLVSVFLPNTAPALAWCAARYRARPAKTHLTARRRQRPARRKLQNRKLKGFNNETETDGVARPTAR